MMSNWDIIWEHDKVRVKLNSANKEWLYLLVNPPLCQICGRSLIRGNICWDTYRHDNLKLADQTFQLGAYYATKKLEFQEQEDFLTQHILGLKDDESFAEPIGIAMAMGIINRYKQLLDADILIPIPSYNISRNHSSLLCEFISSHLESTMNKKIVIQNGLKKIKNIKLHRLPSLIDRATEAENMFESSDDLSVMGKDVILIDDLLTTGDSKYECIRILKNNGARRIWVYVAAGNV